MTHTPHKVTATQREYRFSNGFGASVVCNPYSYGGRSGLFELAVLDDTGNLTYDTPITSDVIGWLTEGEVQEKLDEIAALAPEAVAATLEQRRRVERAERIAELREELARLESEQGIDV